MPEQADINNPVVSNFIAGYKATYQAVPPPLSDVSCDAITIGEALLHGTEATGESIRTALETLPVKLIKMMM